MPRMVVTVTLGAIFGALIGTLPAALAVLAHTLGGEKGNGQYGMGIAILFLLFAPLGMVAGLIGGVMYGAKQRLLTVASPFLGLVVGGIIGMGMSGTLNFIHLVWLGPATGFLLGVVFTIFTWRRVPRQIPSPKAE